MNYIVLDLEWNQPFEIKRMIRKPVTLRGEIIQIGAVKLDEEFRFLDSFKIMVTPKYYFRMHRKVTGLTGITNDDLQYGFPFPFAFKHFSKWCGDDFQFLTWGTEDLRILSSNMALYDIHTEWIPKAYDVQMIYGDQMNMGERQTSLINAMKELGEEELTAHDALNDARNTVCVCTHLDMKKALDEYEDIINRMKKQNQDQLISGHTGKAYSSKLEAFADPELYCFECPSCGGKVICGPTVKQNTDKYICLGKCENGEGYFVRFRFVKKADEEVFVVRLVYELDETHQKYYFQKKKEREDRIFAYETAMNMS